MLAATQRGYLKRVHHGVPEVVVIRTYVFVALWPTALMRSTQSSNSFTVYR